MSLDDELCGLLSDLEPVAKRRVLQASRRAPERLYYEMRFLEQVVDLKRKICTARQAKEV